MLSEEFAVDAGLVVETGEEGLRAEDEKIFPAGFVFGEEDEVVAAFAPAAVCAIGARFFGGRDVGLYAEDGFEVFFFASLVDGDCAEHVAVIGDADGVHAEFGDSIDELVDAIATIEEGVFGVEVEMGETGAEGGTG